MSWGKRHGKRSDGYQPEPPPPRVEYEPPVYHEPPASPEFVAGCMATWRMWLAGGITSEELQRAAGDMPFELGLQERARLAGYYKPPTSAARAAADLTARIVGAFVRVERVNDRPEHPPEPTGLF